MHSVMHFDKLITYNQYRFGYYLNFIAKRRKFLIKFLWSYKIILLKTIYYIKHQQNLDINLYTMASKKVRLFCFIKFFKITLKLNYRVSRPIVELS